MQKTLFFQKNVIFLPKREKKRKKTKLRFSRNRIFVIALRIRYNYGKEIDIKKLPFLVSQHLRTCRFHESTVAWKFLLKQNKNPAILSQTPQGTHTGASLSVALQGLTDILVIT